MAAINQDHHDDPRRDDAYLLDRTGRPDPDVARLEQLLSGKRYQVRPSRVALEARAERAGRGAWGVARLVPLVAAAALIGVAFVLAPDPARAPVTEVDPTETRAPVAADDASPGATGGSGEGATLATTSTGATDGTIAAPDGTIAAPDAPTVDETAVAK